MLPPPPGQTATLPTVSTRPPTVVVPSGRTMVTASPGFTRYSWVTSRSTVTMGVVLVASRTVPRRIQRRAATACGLADQKG